MAYYRYSGLMLRFVILALTCYLCCAPCDTSGSMFETSGFAFLCHPFRCVFTYFIVQNQTRAQSVKGDLQTQERDSETMQDKHHKKVFRASKLDKSLVVYRFKCTSDESLWTVRHL